MTRLAPAALVALAAKHFGAAGASEADIRVAAAIALAESGGRTDALNTNRNGSTDKGLWQINSVHKVDGDLFDPDTNAAAAVGVWERAGKKFTPWVAYKNGAYNKFVEQIKGVTVTPPAVTNPAPTASVPESDTSLAGRLTSGLTSGITSSINSFNEQIAKIASTWAVWMLVGLLAAIGVLLILRKPAVNLASTAIKGTPVGNVAKALG